MAWSWTDPFFHLNDSIEMLSALYQGMTCQPPTIFNKTNSCTQGGYPSYVVNITNVAQVQLAVNFARNSGIRLVVKNTGHDFFGKSGGAGSLSIWTHHLKQVAFMPSYKDSSYAGPALKAGVGIQGYELYRAASDMGYIAMGGECPSVSAMGGWIQGGGHSPFVTTNRDHNPDLYWALRGGGGSTFGVVTSVVTRIHKDVPAITAASWSLATGGNVSTDMFKAALKSYFSTFPNGADNGIYSHFNIFNFGGAMTWTMAPYFAVNKTQSQAQAVLQSWLDKMKALGAPITPKWQTYTNFYDAYNASFPVEGVNNKGVVTASCMFPRETFANQTLFNATFDEWWSNIEAGMALIGYNIAPTWQRGGSQQTAVNPAWRTGIGYFITGIVQDLTQSAAVLTEQRQNFTDTTMKQWHDLTPTSGAYLNEADRLQPDFQWAFWVSKYPQLLQLKKKYDPKNVFYAWTAVGSEYFTVKSADGFPDENGRVCLNASPVEYVAQGPACTQC
ncbi:hypothetical protein LTR78_003077 [Recurvomyces mirabilis]|uniref:FAD-binding PCMH-type domain-containing protein n=1 Tax=Recurvomyces mirabilis TaxID=574656 RepID=A0AAE0WS72_9PEZI|nr:hypothetical protein LTR78_003077 [Recurvomyces mirabilis]KAK5157101.1 hypothetical protein LTS14_004619 [Recurvomyces mirabilis]